MYVNIYVCIGTSMHMYMCVFVIQQLQYSNLLHTELIFCLFNLLISEKSLLRCPTKILNYQFIFAYLHTNNMLHVIKRAKTICFLGRRYFYLYEISFLSLALQPYILFCLILILPYLLSSNYFSICISLNLYGYIVLKTE